MKIYLLLLLSAFFACGSNPDPECSDFHTGTFKLLSDVSENTIITRSGNLQREKNDDTGREMTFDVFWKDDCTYQLFNAKLLRGEKWLAGNPGDTLTVKIVEIKGDSISVISTSNFADLEVEVKLVKMKD